MLCSHRVLLHNGNVDHYHPAWSLEEHVRGKVPSNVQVNVQMFIQVHLEDVSPKPLDKI